MKGVVLSAPPRNTAGLRGGDSGIYEQTVISTKWTKWTHGEISLQKLSPFFKGSCSPRRTTR